MGGCTDRKHGREKVLCSGLWTSAWHGMAWRGRWVVQRQQGTGKSLRGCVYEVVMIMFKNWLKDGVMGASSSLWLYPSLEFDDGGGFCLYFCILILISCSFKCAYES